MTSCAQLVSSSGSQDHLVQLYEADEQALARNVAHYLWEGSKRGEGLLVVATREHYESVSWQLRQLGLSPKAAVREGWLASMDAEETLARFMVDGQPDWGLFETTMGAAMRNVRRAKPEAGLRAYGEMVGLLWKAEQFDAAIRLEGFWNQLLQSGGFQLFCGYPIDVFGKDFQTAAVDALLRAHTHLVPAGSPADLETALNRAMHEVLGPERERAGIPADSDPHPQWAVLPRAEAAILSLRNNSPDQADEVLARARRHYQDEKRFRALIENSSDAISLLDSRGKVLYASASTTRVLGYEPGELVGRSALDFIHPDDIGAVSRTLKEVLARPHCPMQVQVRVRRKDGTWCWVESTSANLLDDPHVCAIVANYRDITERKAAEEEKQRHAEELARTNAELQAFAYAATHDLQEPLRTVCAFTELLVQHKQADEKGKQYSGLIVDGVKRMSALLDDLLSFTRLSVTEHKQRVELREAAEQARLNLAAALDESAATLNIGSLPAVQGNASQLVELFQNLIGNAIKYRSEQPVLIVISASQVGREWVVRVQDNGIGIAPKHYDYVFGLFKRLHTRDVPGTGIGLAVCKKIVEGLGGRIWIESGAGQGSSFCFTVTPDAAA